MKLSQKSDVGQKAPDRMLVNSRFFVVLQESLRQNRMTRFYLQQKEDPHGPAVSLYVGNLPSGLSQRQYEKILIDIVGKGGFRLALQCCLGLS